jgi:predicted nucleotidyltransferase component of viral defense system
MIRKREIAKLAEEQRVAKATIDKDWVLGHFVDAIFSIPSCRDSLVFKGGTCLRKCYFPDYRFSEDLDFTSVKNDFVLDESLLHHTTHLVTERTSIPLHAHEISPLYFQDQLTGFKATVRFWGADHSRNQAPPPPERWTTSIKIEVILYEKMLFPVEQRSVFHPYSDLLSADPLRIPCYSLSEVISEKMRALVQRSYAAPRDFYDIWQLYQSLPDLDWDKIKIAFLEKMAFKGLAFTGIEQMINEENTRRVKVAWVNSLRHQIPSEQLPEFEEVWKGVEQLLGRVFY